jgi:branched-chain amino acid transport system permease protein
MLSLVLLTGYGGFVSLAQFTFAGVGAVAYAKLDQPNLFGLLVAVLISAAVGALVAIPVLRLTGLYLALATLAFAQLMDKLIFQASFAFKIGNPLSAHRLSILGLSFNGTGEYTVLMSVFFVVLSFIVIAVRRGRLGRILVAMRDSQTASSTLGLDLRWMRVGLFAASAGIAGLGGALFAGLRGTIVADDFMYFQSLLVLLVAVVWGVTSVTGVAIGGVFLMYLRYEASPELAGVLFVVLGVGAVIIGRDPNGLANKLFGFNAWVVDRLYPILADRYPGMALRARGEDSDLEPVAEAEERGEVEHDVAVAR